MIDAGVSAKRIATALCDRGIDLSSIQGIFVTHEHSDHISGLRVLANRNKIPVYGSDGTIEALSGMGALNGHFPVHVLEGPQEAAGMEILPFETSHDCAHSCGYVVRTGDGRSIAVCTDLGYVSESVRAAITGCDLVMLESNHDVMMLQNGSYPYPLKLRILSDRGHLSNGSCASELEGLVKKGTTRIILAHLSRENNMPLLALQAARTSLGAAGMREKTDYILGAAPPEGGRVLLL